MSRSGTRPSNSQPQAGVLAVIWRRDRVLLVKRRRSPHANYWGFPGGAVEPGEPFREAARREVREETGIQARPEEPITALDLIQPDEENGPGYHYVLIAVRLTYLQGRIEPGDDAVEADWFSPVALPEPLCPEVSHMVRDSRPTG